MASIKKWNLSATLIPIYMFSGEILCCMFVMKVVPLSALNFSSAYSNFLHYQTTLLRRACASYGPRHSVAVSSARTFRGTVLVLALLLRHIMLHGVAPPSWPPPAVQELCELKCTTRSFGEVVKTPNGGYRVHVADSWHSDAVMYCHDAASFPKKRKLRARIQL